MKRLFLVLIPFFVSLSVLGQTATTKKDTMIRTAANLKSGNSQDVLTSFFQLAYQDISSKKHSFQFQTSGIGLASKFNKNALIDTTYQKMVFARNLNFGFGVITDSNYKVKNATFHGTYALINARDSGLFSFSALPFEQKWFDLNVNALSDYLASRPTNADSLKAKKFIFNGKSVATSFMDLPEAYKKLLRLYLNQDKIFHGMKPDEFRNVMKHAYDSMVTRMRKAPLWTIGVNYAYNQALNLNTEYLKGFTNQPGRTTVELDIRGDFYDSTTTKTHRQLFSFAGGLNAAFLDRNNSSWLEAKLAADYGHVFTGLAKKEVADKVFIDATARFRITKGLWLPLEFKYDTKTSAVFLLFNLKFNFDGHTL